MPSHTLSRAVIAASDTAYIADADLIATVGGGSITDGAKAHPRGGAKSGDP